VPVVLALCVNLYERSSKLQLITADVVLHEHAACLSLLTISVLHFCLVAKGNNCKLCIFGRSGRSEEQVKKLYSSMQCLQADDIASAVVFVLQSPPHMNVNEIYIRPTEQQS